MKKYSFFLILICMSFLFFNSCEKTGIQIKESSDTLQLQLRSDCDECPGEDECCCGIWLEEDDDEADLLLCGTSDGTGQCFGMAVCGISTFSGGGQPADLDETFHPKHLFCMDEGSAIWIYNRDSVDVANVMITCQGDVTAPQILHLQIPPLQRLYYDSNGSCEIDPCQ